jgi:hypothetical protein
MRAEPPTQTQSLPITTFTLNLLGSLEVKSRSTNYVGGAPGWEFQIGGNYEPHQVNNLLQAYKAKAPEYEDITLVGLARVHT